MRNKFPGVCYRCKEWCAAGEGHFEKFADGWRVQHASCAIEHRGEVDVPRQILNHTRMEIKAKGTGRQAQRARKRLRDLRAGGEKVNLIDD